MRYSRNALALLGILTLILLTSLAPLAALAAPVKTTAAAQPGGGAHELMVRLRDDAIARRAVARDGGNVTMARSEIADDLALRAREGLRTRRELTTRHSIQLLRYADAGAASDALEILRSDPRVELVERNVPRQLYWAPTDEEYGEQEWWLDQIASPGAWSITTGRPDVLVAVIDSGVSPTQPDLVDRIAGGYNAVDGSDNYADVDGHGTHVAGIIAAEGSNGIGTAGVAMDARILAIRVMDDEGGIDVATEIDAIYWAVDNGADVINLSLGANEYVALEREAIRFAYDRGVVVVAASGNDVSKISYPAEYSETISVGSVASDGSPSSFTSRVTRVDLAAPGESIYSPGWDDFYGDYWDDVFYSDFYPVSGTSFAAPIVAGVTALIKSVDPAARTEQVRSWLTNTAFDSGPPGVQAGTGSGQVDAEAAVRAATWSAMDAIWTTTDSPVASGEVGRTWLWGEGPDTWAYETYDESLHGSRLVYYYDKSRMEVTDALADRGETWYVTNGLLATELITGRLQLGDNRFQTRGAAEVNVAGDPDDPIGPRYSSFSGLLGASPPDEGSVITQTIGHTGQTGVDARYAGYGVTSGPLIAETRHRVASPFWDYLNSNGVIAVDGGLNDGRLFDPWFYATGFPITEAYWARIKVAGVYTDVLIQCFERRCLTYTPANPSGWQVEMGNVGRHYYEWRYGDPLPD